jgi:hypothetical protein
MKKYPLYLLTFFVIAFSCTDDDQAPDPHSGVRCESDSPNRIGCMCNNDRIVNLADSAVCFSRSSGGIKYWICSH